MNSERSADQSRKISVESVYEAAKAGDEQALADLYEASLPYFLTAARKSTRFDPDELAAEALAEAIIKIKDIRGDAGSFLGYGSKIISRTASRENRKRRSELNSLPYIYDTENAIPSASPEEVTIDQGEIKSPEQAKHDLFNFTLASLKQFTKVSARTEKLLFEVICNGVIEYKELAEKLGVSPESIGPMLSRLRRIMEANVFSKSGLLPLRILPFKQEIIGEIEAKRIADYDFLGTKYINGDEAERYIRRRSGVLGPEIDRLLKEAREGWTTEFESFLQEMKDASPEVEEAEPEPEPGEAVPTDPIEILRNLSPQERIRFLKGLVQEHMPVQWVGIMEQILSGRQIEDIIATPGEVISPEGRPQIINSSLIDEPKGRRRKRTRAEDELKEDEYMQELGYLWLKNAVDRQDYNNIIQNYRHLTRKEYGRLFIKREDLDRYLVEKTQIDDFMLRQGYLVLLQHTTTEEYHQIIRLGRRYTVRHKNVLYIKPGLLDEFRRQKGTVESGELIPLRGNTTQKEYQAIKVSVKLRGRLKKHRGKLFIRPGDLEEWRRWKSTKGDRRRKRMSKSSQNKRFDIKSDTND